MCRFRTEGLSRLPLYETILPVLHDLYMLWRRGLPEDIKVDAELGSCMSLQGWRGTWYGSAGSGPSSHTFAQTKVI